MSHKLALSSPSWTTLIRKRSCSASHTLENRCTWRWSQYHKRKGSLEERKHIRSHVVGLCDCNSQRWGRSGTHEVEDDSFFPGMVIFKRQRKLRNFHPGESIWFHFCRKLECRESEFWKSIWFGEMGCELGMLVCWPGVVKLLLRVVQVGCVCFRVLGEYFWGEEWDLKAHGSQEAGCQR